MKRGLYRSRAVVLNSVDYAESDRILAFFTLEHGKISGIAKGARRSRRRFVGKLDPLSHIDLVFSVGSRGELAFIEEASLVDAFNGLKADIERLSEACYLLELTSEMTREGQVMPAVYHTLVEFLRMLEAARCLELLRFFEIRLLSLAGYLPHLVGCVVCRGEASGVRLSFSSERGGIVCRGCSTGLPGLIAVSPGTTGLLSMASRLDGDKLGRLRPGQAFLEESERLLYDFIRFHIGKELKTRRFMEKLRGAGA